MLSALLASSLTFDPLGCAGTSVARGEAERPSLSGPASATTVDEGRFQLHWTTEGADAVSPADADINGIPDVVDRLGRAAASAREHHLAAGHRAIVPDDGGATDIYLRRLPVNGYAYALGPAPAACFVEIDPSLFEGGDLVLESVVAHELFHCVQYASTTAAPTWISESTATWVQYDGWRSPLLDAARDILWNDRLRGFDRAIDDVGERFEYAGFIIWDHWQRSGTEDRARHPQLWEALADDGRWRQALDSESQRLWGRSFAETFAEFASWGLFACALSDGRWSLPCDLPAVRVDWAELPVGGPWAGELAIGDHTAAFARFDTMDGQGWALDCDVEGGSDARFGAFLVDDLGGVREEAWVGGGEGATLSLRLGRAAGPDDHIRVVFVSTDGAEPGPRWTCDSTTTEADPEPTRREDAQEGDERGCGSLGGAAILLLPTLRRRRRTARRTA